MSSSHQNADSFNDLTEAIVSALAHSKTVLELLHNREHRLSARDIWELDELAAELGIKTGDITLAILRTWEIEDERRHLVRAQETSSFTLMYGIVESSGLANRPEDSAAECIEGIRGIELGEANEISPPLSSETRPALLNSTGSRTVEPCTSDETRDTSLLEYNSFQENTNGHTRVCDKCGYFYYDPDSDLYPDIDKEYDFHGVCPQCIARVNAPRAMLGRLAPVPELPTIRLTDSEGQAEKVWSEGEA